MLLPLGLVRLMLLPLYYFEADVTAFSVAEVVAWWLMLLPHAVLADVIAKVVDVKSTHGCVSEDEVLNTTSELKLKH